MKMAFNIVPYLPHAMYAISTLNHLKIISNLQVVVKYSKNILLHSIYIKIPQSIILGLHSALRLENCDMSIIIT